MITDMKRTAERIPLEVMNTGNYGLLDELLVPEFVDHSPVGGVAPTREGLKSSAKALRTAFPDIRYTIEDSIAYGDQIVHRLSATGTMTGEFMGVPPTGKRATIRVMDFVRYEDGRIAEHWNVVDVAGLMAQLGAA